MVMVINYPVEQSAFWEADSFLGSQEIFRNYATRSFTTVHKSPLLVPAMSQINKCEFLASHSGVAEIPGEWRCFISQKNGNESSRNPISYFFKVYFNTILLCIHSSLVQRVGCYGDWIRRVGQNRVARTYGKNRGSWTRTLIDPHFSRIKYIFRCY
jgi:hypothetical protein